MNVIFLAAAKRRREIFLFAGKITEAVLQAISTTTKSTDIVCVLCDKSKCELVERPFIIVDSKEIGIEKGKDPVQRQ